MSAVESPVSSDQQTGGRSLHRKVPNHDVCLLTSAHWLGPPRGIQAIPRGRFYSRHVRPTCPVQRCVNMFRPIVPRLRSPRVSNVARLKLRQQQPHYLNARSYASASGPVFDWQDPLASNYLLTEDEIAIAETAERYCQEQLLPRVLRKCSIVRLQYYNSVQVQRGQTIC